ncbi:hypothetical protein [Taklimakanibacter deserti]|uniref:hypothetical protein n=1 Tax=Taklimakanibacter deserti TaxID=2267839 RepID=UPI000E6575FD
MEPVTMAAAATAAIGVASAGVETAGALAGDAKDKAAAEARARMAKINSDESETIALADFKRQLSNIKAIRASAGGLIDTPTMNAIIDAERATSDENRRRVRTGYKMEELQAKSDAKMISDMAFFRIAGGALKGAKSIVGSGVLDQK